VKTTLEGKRFQDAEDISGKVKVEINAVPLEIFADYFQKLLNDSTNVFKLKKITLNRNNRTLSPCIFLPFSHQPGNFVARLATRNTNSS
jgi:hypothetical protein